MEEWRPIKSFGYNADKGFALYEVSSIGRVRKSAHTDFAGRFHFSRLLSPITDKRGNGAQRVVLSDGTSNRRFSVHKLVAEAFIPNPNNSKTVRWLDNDPLNNFVSNLYWVVEDKDAGVGSGAHYRKPIRVYSADKDLLFEFISASEGARQLGLAKNSITQCCRRETAAYVGLLWRYVENDELYREGAIPLDSVEELKKICNSYVASSEGPPVRQYDLDGHLVNEYLSVAKAAQNSGTWRSCILRCCDRTGTYSNNFIWRYAHDDELFKLSETERFLLIKRYLAEHGHFTVRKYDFSGRLVATYHTATEAGDFNRSSRMNIIGVCKRWAGRLSAFGFIWRYEYDDELFHMSESERKAYIESEIKPKSDSPQYAGRRKG